MGFSHRMLLIDQNDRLYRLAITKFEAMLRSSTHYRFPQFAGQRIRAAGVSVELIDRQPSRVIRVTYNILTFDEAGQFDAAIFNLQQSSRAELAMASAIPSVVFDQQDAMDVVDAATRFIEHGGRWAPSPALTRTIHEAALGSIKCPAL